MESMFNKDSKLIDLIKVYKNVIPKSLCNDFINRSVNFEWKGNYRQPNEKFAISSSFLDESTYSEYLPIIKNSVAAYNNDVAQPFYFGIKEIIKPEMHKFTVGTKMLLHHDHGIKGAPTLTTLGLLNDDFEGGEFLFWNDEVVKIEAGDMLLFPALFAYLHQVTPITKGTRYSIISWVF